MSTHVTMRTRSAAAVAMAALAALTLLAPAQAVTATEGTTVAGPGGTTPAAEWAQRRAVAVPEETDRWGRDLPTVRRLTRDSEVVALGEGGHGIKEVTELKARYLRFLVEERGFRTIAWEDDWSLGTQVNDYLHGDRDDLASLLPLMSTAWRNQEVAELLRWLRRYNDTHPDDVDFVGVEYFSTRALSYDAVESYVSTHAPRLLPRLRAAFAVSAELDDGSTFALRPGPHDAMGARVTTYFQRVVDKQPFIDAAEDVVDLVASIEGTPHRERAVALHHARQISSWYVGFSLPWSEIPDHRDARAAENVAWARSTFGSKVVYWGHSAHAADAPRVTISGAGADATSFRPVGSYLADWYGEEYVTIGFTFDHGTQLDGESGVAVAVPPADESWFEAPLADVTHAQFLLSLHRPYGTGVRQWLDRPMSTRGAPSLGSDSTITGGTPRGWFDAVVHRQVVTAATPLGY